MYTAASQSPSAVARVTHHRPTVASSTGSTGTGPNQQSIWRPFTPSLARSSVAGGSNPGSLSSIQQSFEVSLQPIQKQSKRCCRQQQQQQLTPGANKVFTAKPNVYKSANEMNSFESPQKTSKSSSIMCTTRVFQTERNDSASKSLKKQQPQFVSPPSPAQLPPPVFFSSSHSNVTSIVVPPSYTFPRNYLDEKFHGYHHHHQYFDERFEPEPLNGQQQQQLLLKKKVKEKEKATKGEKGNKEKKKSSSKDDEKEAKKQKKKVKTVAMTGNEQSPPRSSVGIPRMGRQMAFLEPFNTTLYDQSRLLIQEKEQQQQQQEQSSEGIGCTSLRLRLGGWLVRLGRRLLRNRSD